jgi:hypothetical protein
MSKIPSIIIFFIAVLTMNTSLEAQNVKKKNTQKDTIRFGYGYSLVNDLYHVYTNPKDNISSPRSGSAILNLGAGPKLWLGNSKMSVSIEGQVMWGILGLSSKNNKGLGTIAFPVIANLNFKGLSSFEREGKLGFSIGGGIQYSKTELYGLRDEYVVKGVKRSYFQTFILQAGYGFGVNGFDILGFTRYGFHPDTDAKTLNIGLQWNFNKPMLKRIANPASQL